MGVLDGFTPQELENAKGFSSFQVGDNTAIIDKVEETYSKNGSDMLVIHFANDTGAKIRYYIVDNEYKLQKLRGLYLAFGIPFTEKNPQRWLGKTGVVVCKEGKPYNGETWPEVNYVKPLPSRSGNAPGPAPAYSAPEPSQGGAPKSDDGFADDIPF
jgi:hypothetical protein